MLIVTPLCHNLRWHLHLEQDENDARNFFSKALLPLKQKTTSVQSQIPMLPREDLTELVPADHPYQISGSNHEANHEAVNDLRVLPVPEVTRVHCHTDSLVYY